MAIAVSFMVIGAGALVLSYAGLVGYIEHMRMRITGYEAQKIAVQGLPNWLTIWVAEIFALVFEGGLVYLLGRKTIGLSWWQAALLSLAMNATSFLVGRSMLG